MGQLIGLYCIFLANLDKLRDLDDNRDTLCDVTWDGCVVGTAFYDNAYRMEAAGLEDVFERLNMNHPADYQRRSLSVGDVVVAPDGTAYVCKPCGWQSFPATRSFTRCAQEFGGDWKATRAARVAEMKARWATQQAGE